MRYFKIEKALVSLIIILFFSLSCSPKLLISKEEEILSREIVKSWVELQSEIVRLNQKEILLHLKEIECRAIRDSIKSQCLYKYGKKDKSGEISKDYSVYFTHFLGGLGILMGGSYWICQGFMADAKFNLLKVISGATIATGGCLLMQEWPKQLKTVTKISGSGIEEKTICKEKGLLVKEPVTILLNGKFEKEYVTDSLGNILINREELIPYIPECDSNVMLKIIYKDINTKLFIQ